jgi:uncharacterized protein YbjQ (UPF0145 family)
MELGFIVMILFYIIIPFTPWVLSLVGTLLYQPSQKKALFEREATSAKSGDSLSTLSKPFVGREVQEFELVMASVVMGPSWIQIVVGGILSLFGGEINTFTKVVDWARREAKQRLREQVASKGFDDVINMRIETTVMSKTRGGKDKTTGVEILVYGTAIKY